MNVDENNIFGERLKRLRKEKDIVMEDMAEDLNTTQATISRYERGKRKPDIVFLNLVADYFDVSTDYLLGKTDEENPKYKNTDKFITIVRKKVEEYGYDISDKTDDEIAKMIVKSLKLDEINEI